MFGRLLFTAGLWQSLFPTNISVLWITLQLFIILRSHHVLKYHIVMILVSAHVLTTCFFSSYRLIHISTFVYSLQNSSSLLSQLFHQPKWFFHTLLNPLLQGLLYLVVIVHVSTVCNTALCTAQLTVLIFSFVLIVSGGNFSFTKVCLHTTSNHLKSSFLNVSIELMYCTCFTCWSSMFNLITWFSWRDMHVMFYIILHSIFFWNSINVIYHTLQPSPTHCHYRKKCQHFKHRWKWEYNADGKPQKYLPILFCYWQQTRNYMLLTLINKCADVAAGRFQRRWLTCRLKWIVCEKKLKHRSLRWPTESCRWKYASLKLRKRRRGWCVLPWLLKRSLRRPRWARKKWLMNLSDLKQTTRRWQQHIRKRWTQQQLEFCVFMSFFSEYNFFIFLYLYLTFLYCSVSTFPPIRYDF